MERRTFRLHRPNPSHSLLLFLYAGYKRAILATTLLSNREGHFSPTDQNDQTSQSGPPSKLISPEYSSQTKLKWSVPLILMNQLKFLEFWVEWKAPKDSSLSRILRFTPRLHTAYLPKYFQLFLLKVCHTVNQFNKWTSLKTNENKSPCGVQTQLTV